MALTPISTTALIALKQQLPPQFKPALKMFFNKGVVTFNTQSIAFDRIKKGRKLAPFVSPMVSGVAKKSKGGVMTSIEPAYIKETDVVTSDRLLKRMPGEQLLGVLSPSTRLNAIRADMLMEQEEAIQRTEEWMFCELLKTGAVTISAPDFEAINVDYGRSPQNNVTLAGADRWQQQNKETSRKPLDDIEDWADRCNIVADTVIMGKAAWREFRSFKIVRELLDNHRGTMSEGELMPLNNSSFKRVGRYGEFDIYVYSGAYEKQDGTVATYFDDNGILVTGMDLDIFCAYGGIQDVKANAMGIVEATRYPSNWFSDNPSVEWLQTQSAPVPVMFDPDECVYARV